MKKTNLYLTLILVALVTIILITGIILIVVLSDGESENSGTDGSSTTVSTTVKTPAPGTTTKTPSTTPMAPSTTTAPTTTATPAVTATVPKPTTTTKTPATTPTDPAVTTPAATTTTQPATTTKPVTPIPVPGGASGVIAGEKAGSLGIYAAYATEPDANDPNKITVKVTFYVESYGLRIGARNDNYLLVNGETLSGLDSDAISLPDKTPLTQSILYEYETTVKKNGDDPVTLELEFFWHFQASYSGVHAEWLSVKADLVF